ncbi:MAG: hypothetical protein J5950_03215 [Clostridia bacterium]|nr:hypothetical protein [Clostridia bacterium]
MTIKLRGLCFSPGYCDMLGGAHSTSLERNENGNWIFVSRDREEHTSPTVVSTYSVSSESVAEFENYIKSRKVFSLAKRPKSDLFVTDYSPWTYSIEYDKTVLGKTKREYCRITEYKKYSKKDNDRIKELHDRFMALRGQVLSQTANEDDI